MAERYGIILLAAGLSSRFAAGDKLLHPWRGQPLLAWSAAQVRAAPVTTRVAVIGPDDAAKRTLLDEQQITCVVNLRPADGMGTSLAVGARTLPADLTGVFIVLGDMPALPPDIFAELIALRTRNPRCTILAPTYQQRRGHPVLFCARHLPALCELHGDQGARAILDSAAATTCELPVADGGVLRDFDTVEAFAD